MAKIIAWVLIVFLSCWIIGNAVSIIKTVIARKKGPSGEDKNHAGEEEKKDE